MDNNSPLTEAEILDEVSAPCDANLAVELARSLMTVQFQEATANRIRELLQKNNAGTLSLVEESNLERCLRVGQFLDLLRAKARLSLRQRSANQA